MSRLRRLLPRLATIAGVLLILAQFVPVDRTNPPVEQDVAAPADVDSILRRACYDCHSNETVWPWYSRIAPVSWLVVHDTNEGREHVNFSTWNRLSPAERDEVLEELWEEVEADGMPLPIYVPMHPEARLSDADKAALQAWVRASTAR
jgi:cytochrome c551/c552